jgi:hypothetical protein
MRPVIISLSYESQEAIAQQQQTVIEGHQVLARLGKSQSIRRVRTLMVDPTRFLARHPAVSTPAEQACVLARYVGLGCHVTRESHAGRSLPNPDALAPTAALFEPKVSGDGEVDPEAVWLRLPNPPRPMTKGMVDAFMASIIIPTLTSLGLEPKPFVVESPLWSDLLDTVPDSQGARQTTQVGDVPVYHIALEATPGVVHSFSAEKVLEGIARRRGEAPASVGLIEDLRANRNRLFFQNTFAEAATPEEGAPTPRRKVL